MKKLPAIQFYPGDWRKDPGVQALDLETRGAWFELLLIMHESEERGFLMLNGKSMPDEAASQILGITPERFKQIRSKLLSYGVASVDQKTGALCSRRLIRDNRLRDLRAKCGSIGGTKTQANAKQKSTPSFSSSLSFSNKPPFPLLKDPENCFENVWVRYPNKDGRKAAHKHFMVSVKTQKDFDDITRALTNYLASERVKKGFVKNGSTWFNNWRDWVATQTATAPAKKQCIACDKMFDADSFAAHFEKCREEFNHRNSAPLPGAAGKLVSQVAGSRGV